MDSQSFEKYFPKSMTLPCCGLSIDEGFIGPVHANPGNQCVQCHNCGAQYVLKEK